MEQSDGSVIEYSMKVIKMNIDNLELDKATGLSDEFETLFWQYGKELVNCDSRRMLFKKYMSKASILGELAKDKPANKVNMITEYVKVNHDHAWQAVRDFEEGRELYGNAEGTYSGNTAERVVCLHRDKSLYRKVERPITWQEAVNDKYPAIDFNDLDETGRHDMGEWSQDEIIEFCHLVTSLTKRE